MNNIVIIFGGADRNQCHYGDIVVSRPSTGFNVWEKIETTGDVPMPRSGHSVAAFGRYMLLFGGIDFAEEAVFNDLYSLNTGSFLSSFSSLSLS